MTGMTMMTKREGEGVLLQENKLTLSLKTAHLAVLQLGFGFADEI